MKNKKKLCIAGMVLLVLGLLAALAVNTASSQGTQSDTQQVNATSGPTTVPKPVNVYSAKFVCGNASKGGPVLNGNYATAINVHNPQITTANLKKKAVIALPEGPIKGNISNFMPFSLNPDEAFEIDCSDISGILKNSSIPMPAFTKGFVVIESPADLDVVGVYTAGGANVESIDVETINSKSIIPCGKTNISLNTGQGRRARDPFWNLTDPPIGPAFVVTSPNSGWAPALPGSQWISWQTSAASNTTPKNYTYELNFDLPICASNPYLNMSVLVDNEAWVYLNGIPIRYIPPGVNPNYAFRIPTVVTDTTRTDFVFGGTNTLTVVVGDDSPPVTGLDIAGTVTAI